MKKLNMFRIFSIALMLMMSSVVAFAQLTVQGTVIDQANGEPIIGASILEVGTTNGTITDFDGNFTLNVQPGAKLSISYMGYKTQELAATSSMKVSMGEDTEVLDEVVVVGYGVVKKNDATGSVTAIKPDEMNKGLQTNAQDMIQGKIAGVNVSTDGGTPGGGATIRIRGGSSLNASNDPLIVIDGLAMDNNGILGVSNPLSLVNPNDIETFTVLKDASATAIYGSRASNGVILITTKKGKAGQKMKVTYDGNVSFGTVVKHLGVLNGDELRAYATASGQSAQANQYLMNDDVDWFKQIYRTAISTDHNISLTGGFKNKNVDMPYRAVKGSQMQRVTAALNLNPSFLDNHLTFNINAKGMYIYNEYEPGIAGAYLDKDPTQPIYSTGDLTNIDGNLILAGSANEKDYYVTKEELDTHWDGFFQPLGISDNAHGPYEDTTWMYSLKSQANPLAMLKHQSNTSHAGQFVGNMEANYKIHGFEDLVLHANFGADYSFAKKTNKNSLYGTANHYTGWDGWEKKMKYNLQFNCFAQYGHDWEEAHQHFDIMAGYEWQHFYNEYNSEGNGMYPLTYLDVTKAGQPAYASKSTGKGENYLVSFFGRLNWIGWNQIMVTATVRGDGSSRFSKNHRWGVFPSVAVGWKIKESFMKDVHWLNDLKLRLGYGITGQQEGIGDYSYMPSYTQTTGHTSYYPVGGTNYATENNDVNIVEAVTDINGDTLYISDRPNGYNPDLTWEKTTTYNAGLDFAFLNNRISGSIDYYYRKTTDLLNNVNVAMGTNFRKRVMSNVGSLRNQGVEFAINAVILDYGKKFKWDLGYNVTWNENRITKINGEETMIDGSGYAGVGLAGKSITKYAVDKPTNVFYLYEAQKCTREDGSQYWTIVDQNNDGSINEQDKVFKHSPVAPVTMGFQMKFQFYNFDLGMSFRANIGNYVFNNVIATRLQNVPAGNLTRDNYYKNLPIDVFDTYYVDGYNTKIYNADGSAELKDADYDITDRFLENASFLRCDNITLGYSLTKNKVSGRAFCTVSNPFIVTKYSGLDPEIGLGGVDNSIYPRSMTTVLGINLQF